MMDLILPLKAEYFDQIKAGEKLEEYRLVNEYWRKRLDGRSYDRVIITKGYPKRCDTERRMVFAWRGYVEKMIVHPHFGSDPVRVYAIKLGTGGHYESLA
jgi:hypothetical protein